MRDTSSMSVVEEIARLSEELPPEKQAEVLDFVEFLVSRHIPLRWTAEKRRSVVASTMGCLAQTRTSSEAFARRKTAEKDAEDRRWRS